MQEFNANNNKIKIKMIWTLMAAIGLVSVQGMNLKFDRETEQALSQ